MSNDYTFNCLYGRWVYPASGSDDTVGWIGKVEKVKTDKQKKKESFFIKVKGDEKGAWFTGEVAKKFKILSE